MIYGLVKYLQFSILIIIMSASSFANSDDDILLFEQGIPKIENFSDNDFGAEANIYDLTIAKNGFTYAINPRGILEFDGYSWRLIHRYQSSSKDRITWFNNRLYYIKEQKIGFLYPDPQGNFADSVLVEGHDLNAAHAQEKFQIIDSLLFIISNKFIVRTDGENEFTRIKSENHLCGNTVVNNQLLIYVYKSGLNLLTDNTFEVYYTDNWLKEKRVYDILSVNNNHFLLNIIHQGVYTLKNLKLNPFFTEARYFNKGAKISHNKFLYGSLMNGIFVFNEKGKIIQHISNSVGLVDNNITDIVLDQHQHVWVGTKNGISHVAINDPYRIYDKGTGLFSNVLNTVHHQGHLYVCTKNSLFRVRHSGTQKFEPEQDIFQLVDEVSGVSGICYEVYSFHNYLLLASTSGLFVIDGLSATPQFTYPFTRRAGIEDYIFVKTLSGYSYYQLKNNEIRRFTHENWMLHDLIFGKNKLWFIDSAMVTELNYSQGYFTSHQFNLLPLEKYIKGYFAFSDSSKLYYSIPGKVYSRETDRKIWKLHKPLCSLVDSTKIVADCYYASDNGTYLLSLSDLNDYHNYKTLYCQTAGDSLIRKIDFSAFIGNIRINSIYLQSENLWWISTQDGLLAFNPIKAESLEISRNAIIRSITFSDSHKKIWLDYGKQPNIIRPFSRNEIIFEFTSNSFKDKSTVKYSYRLEGLQDSWSNYSSGNSLNLANIREGEYTLFVKALYADGTVCEAKPVHFVITPPLQRTTVAYILYLSLLGVAIYLLFKWRLHYLKQERDRLERKVDRRTQQLNSTNEQLLLKTEELQEMDKVKSNFFANISHELRTPLTLILGPLNNLIGSEKNIDKRKELFVMQRNSKVLKQHIEQFLELSKIESGKLTLHKQVTELNTFVKCVVSSFESLAEIKKTDLTFYEPQQKVVSDIDLKNIEIVLNNLLSNALKFTNSGGKVDVALSVNETGAIIQVKDTGIGIAESQLPYIFKRFYQADTTISKNYEGTGIGLALAKEIVELHGGKIYAESTFGKGSTFTIELQLSKAKPEESIESTHSQPDIPNLVYYSEEEITNANEKPMVLVVEDNPDMQQYLINLLKPQFRVHTALNGQEGFEKARELDPHLIISDVMMPIKDGFSMVDDIRSEKRTSHIPVIMLTARADEESKLKGLKKGVEEYLSKPFSQEELLIRIQNIVKRRAAEGQKLTKKLSLEPQELEMTSIDERFLLEAGEEIENHLTDTSFDIQQLSDNLGMSRRHLHRKIKLLTDHSPSEFVRSYRLKKAAQMLSQNADTVSQVAYAVGFDDLSYFSKCFKTQFGQSPSEFGS